MKKNNKNIIVIAGPTATGKTTSAIEIAYKLNGEIVNFDSLLFYKELIIGTAKPSVEEMDKVAHHLISSHSIFDPINAADFKDKAIPIINEIHARGKMVVLVGGSGFYLQALLKGMYQSPTTPVEVLEKSNEIYAQEGITPFINFLHTHDIESHQQYHANDHYRIRRAVEHFWANNTKFSSRRSEMKDLKRDSPTQVFQWKVLQLYLDIPKAKHFEIILSRTDTMFTQGLISEVENILSDGATGQEKPLCSIGYKEVISYLKGEFPDLASCKERISINTRRLAKSQRTWFNREDKAIRFNPLTEQKEIMQYCEQFMEVNNGN